MPRVVDHDQRRAELAAAAARLVRERGVAALSVRNLAAWSGWSAGAVRHYLPSHQAMLDMVAAHVREGFEARLLAVPPQDDPVAHLRALLHAALPLDDESRELSQVWFAFMGSEVHQPQCLGALVYDDLSAVLTDYFARCRAAGLLRAPSARQAAVGLQASLDGLTAHLLLDRIDAAEAMEAVDLLLDALLMPADGGVGSPR